MTYFYTSAHLRGDNVYIRGYANGKAFRETQEITPYLFFPDDDGDYKTLTGKRAKKREFSSVKAAKDYIKSQENVANSEYYGLNHFLYTHLNDEFSGTIKYDPTLIARVSTDIETMSDGGFPDVQEADKEVTAVTFSHRRGKSRKIMMFGTRPYTPKHPEAKFVLCKDERAMFEAILDLWNDPEWTPDVVTGWNVEGFDIPYLINRTRRILGDGPVKLWSPWRIVQERDIVRGKDGSRGGKNIANRTDTVYELFGITVLDYLQLYKKFSFQNHESFKLDHIAFVELGERKLDYSEYGSLHNFYLKNYEGYMDYNLDDTLKIDKLDDKLKLIDLVLAMAYDAKVTFSDTMTTTRPWDVIIHNYLMDQRIVIPQYKRSESAWSLVGGYVKNTVPGMYEWVVSCDLNSLYPHLIMQYNISPETLTGKEEFSALDEIENRNLVPAFKEWLSKHQKDNVVMAANGCLYTKSKQGFLPALMQKMYDDRVVYKKAMLHAQREFERTKDPEWEKEIARNHNMQLAKKIQLNSAYGALANEFFRWFNINNAEAVTTSGQMAIRYIEDRINARMNKIMGTSEYDYIIAIDTDSLYIHFGPLVEKVGLTDRDQILDFIDKAMQTNFEPFIEKCYEEMAELVNAFDQKMVMKRETIATKGIFSAKKMYILNAMDIEGVRFSEPKIKMKGVQAVRSSTPLIVRDKIKKAYDIIMNKTEKDLHEFVEEFREEFKTLPFEDVAFPRGCNNIDEYTDPVMVFKKGTPIQVKGALFYNKLIDDLDLGNKYEKIYDKAKIKFAYLKTPNHLHTPVIAVLDKLPPEFNVQEFIDYDTQFEKTFQDPISKITDIVGWKTEAGSMNLMDLLG